MKSLAANLFLREKIKTTEARAKELRSFAERQISRAKTDSVQSRRMLARFFTREVVKKLISQIAPRYKGRKGGYTRTIKLGARKSNGAKMAVIELVK